MNWYIATIAVFRVDEKGSGPLPNRTEVEIHRFDMAMLGDDTKALHDLHPLAHQTLARDHRDYQLVYARIWTLRPAVSGDDYRMIASEIDVACGKVQPRENWRTFGVACPRCEAKPGHPCITHESMPLPSSLSSWYFHSERIAACKSK